MNILKRNPFFFLLFIFAAALAGVLSALPAQGATSDSPCVVLSSNEKAPAAVPGGIAVLPDDASIAVSGDAEGAERSENGETVTVVLTGEKTDGENEARTVRKAMLSVTEDADLSAFDSLSTNVLLSPPKGETPFSCTLTLSLYTDRDIFRFRADLFPGEVKTVVFDLTSIKDRSSVKRISATFEWNNVGEESVKIIFSRLYGTVGVKTPNSSMSSLSISSGTGKLTASDSSLTLAPADGVCDFTARIDPSALPESGEEKGKVPIRYAALTLTADGGSVSAEFNGMRESDRVLAAIAQTRQVFKGEHIYLFRFISDDAETVKFVFQSPDGGEIIVRSLEFFTAGYHDPTVDFTGCVISGTIKDGVLSVEGKLKKNAAVELVGKNLVLLTAPATGGEPVRLAESRAGTAFSFSVPLSSLPREGRENYFWVSVLEDDGEVQITEKHFLFTVPPAEGNESVFGLYGAEPAGVFEAGMNRAVVDVELDRLTGGGHALSSGLAVIRDSDTYYLNEEYVRTLDAEMEFYKASGIGVYLSFTVGDPAAWFREGTDPSEDDPRGIGLYLALTSFFCGRYGNISSIVVPDVRGADTIGEDASRAALLARLTYASASVNYESFTVTIPVTGLGDGEDGETFAALVAESLYQMGEIPWSILTATEKSTFDGLDTVIASARANGTSAPSFSALILTAEGKSVEDAAHEFLDLCVSGRETGSRAVILSVPSLSGAGLIDYSILRGKGKDHDDLPPMEALDYSAVEPFVASSAVLWDFRDSYSTEGWVAGSGIGSFGTAFFSGRSGARTLRATLDAESSHGIILRSFPETVNFSLFPLIEFDLSVSSDDGAVIMFMFGSDVGDVEYVLDCPPGTGEERIVCDLDGLPGDGGINWFSVLIRSEGTATVDIFKISAHSRTKTDGTVRIDGESADGAGPGRPFDRRIVYVSVAAGIIMIPLGIHFFRSDRDASFEKARRRREREK